jgi:hypothetical protein
MLQSLCRTARSSRLAGNHLLTRIIVGTLGEKALRIKEAARQFGACFECRRKICKRP